VKNFEEQEYSHVQHVFVRWPDCTLASAVKGLNKGHAMWRARWNWEDAENITAVTEEEYNLLEDIQKLLGGK